MMLTPSNIQMFLTEAAPAATVASYPQLETERRSGNNPTLAERCAR
jgi:hypothetical protein